MSRLGDLLVASSSDPHEYALAAAMSAELKPDYEGALDPYTAPTEWLPLLAAEHSVDLWYEDWPEERKREVIAQAAGVSKLYPGQIADLKTTRPGTIRYLAQVDAEVVDAIAYPHRPFVGRYPVGRYIIDHPALKLIFLIKVTVPAPAMGHAVGRHPVGRRAVRTVDWTPINRASDAIRVAKADFTQVLMDFTNARVITAGAAITAGAGLRAGDYLTRTKLGPKE